MPKKKPAITKGEFDKVCGPLSDALRDRLEEAVEPIGASPPPSAKTAEVFKGVVLVDSKFVATQLRPLVKKWMGEKFPLKFIKKGGYPSVEAALDHLLPQLRDWCGDTVAAGAPAQDGGA